MIRIPRPPLSMPMAFRIPSPCADPNAKTSTTSADNTEPLTTLSNIEPATLPNSLASMAFMCRENYMMSGR